MSGAYRIVVGVDGSEGGQRALRWAIHEAGTRGGTVHATTAYTVDDTSYAGEPELDIQVAQMLAAQVVAALDDDLDVPITTEVTYGTAAEVLANAARDADLLVLGSHGHGRLFHTVLGSVIEACIRTAPCPVVVIPVPQRCGVVQNPGGSHRH